MKVLQTTKDLKRCQENENICVISFTKLLYQEINEEMWMDFLPSMQNLVSHIVFLCIQGKRTTPVENTFNRNCTLLWSWLYHLRCNFDKKFLYIYVLSLNTVLFIENVRFFIPACNTSYSHYNKLVLKNSCF